MAKSGLPRWKQISDACENDDVVECLFDHIRNIGIAGIVTAASERCVAPWEERGIIRHNALLTDFGERQQHSRDKHHSLRDGYTYGVVSVILPIQLVCIYLVERGLIQCASFVFGPPVLARALE